MKKLLSLILAISLLLSVFSYAASAAETDELTGYFSSQIDLSEDFDESHIIVYVHCGTLDSGDFPELSLNGIERIIDGSTYDVYKLELANSGRDEVIKAIKLLDPRYGCAKMTDISGIPPLFIAVNPLSESTPLDEVISQIDTIDHAKFEKCIERSYYDITFSGDLADNAESEDLTDMLDAGFEIVGDFKYRLYDVTWESVPAIHEAVRLTYDNFGEYIAGINKYSCFGIETDMVIPGDVDGSRNVNITDFMLLKTALWQGKIDPMCDVNFDGNTIFKICSALRPLCLELIDNR